MRQTYAFTDFDSADISDDEKAEPALKLSEQTDIFKVLDSRSFSVSMYFSALFILNFLSTLFQRSRKEESIFSEDILMDLFPETEKVTQNTTEQER